MNPIQQSRTLLAAALLSGLTLAGARGVAAQGDREIAIPSDTVVRLRLEERLSSATARQGDTFAARLDERDASGFPTGTRFQGTVTEVQRYQKNERPGVLDVRFRTAYLPDGQKVSVDGRLASLSDDDVRHTSDGRVEAKKRGGGSKPDWKWAGYGAAGGAVLSTIFGGNLLKGALLGGVGGAIYGYLNRDKDKATFRDVDLPSGSEFGMRLDNRVAFDNRSGYRYAATASRANNPDNGVVNPRTEQQVAGERAEYRFGTTTVLYNGRNVSLGELRPMNVNGTLYVPLRPVAEAANLRFDHRAGDDRFSIQAPTGTAYGNAGERTIDIGSNRTELDRTPLAIDGEIFVPAEYLSRVAELRTYWNRQDRRLELESYR